MRRSLFAGAAAATAAMLAVFTLAPAGASAGKPAGKGVQPVVSQGPVSWTPNVSAGPTVGAPACNATFFGGGNLSCQSEVYSTAYVNGDVVAVGAFTEACQPGRLGQGQCKPGTQVVRNDIFAYKAGTGVIDAHFTPVLNAGPAWTVVPGPARSDTVYVGGAFTTVNGLKHKGIVQLNVRPGVTKGSSADGSVVTGFRANVSGYVRDLALSPDGKALYAGGQFSTVNSSTEHALVRLKAGSGAVDPSFSMSLGDPISGLPTKVEAMALSPDGTHLAVSGSALQLNGQPRPRLAIIDTGRTLGAKARLSDWTAPILANNCTAEHDYVRSLAFSPRGGFLVVGTTGYLNDGSMPFSACDAVARFNVDAANTTTTGTPVSVPPTWINYAGGDSFYSVATGPGVVYAGGHNRWVNNYCGVDAVCEPNAMLADGISALDGNTGMALAWWHPQTLRGAGTMYLGTFPAGTYDGTRSGLVLGTDVDLVGGTYHSENAVFPQVSTTEATRGGPIPSGMFNNEDGSNTGTPMCLDDPGDARTGPAPAELSTCLNVAEQDFAVPTDGTIRINGLCLGTRLGRIATGTAAVLDKCGAKKPGRTQVWTQGAGNTLISPAASAKDGGPVCLDDPGLSTTSGTQLQIARCTGSRGQSWPLPAAPAPPAPPVAGPIWSSLKQASTQVPCLDDARDSLATGTKVQLWTCRGDAEQRWTAESNHTIQLRAGYCLDTAGGATSQGTAVVLNPCKRTPASSQVWKPGPNGSLAQQASGLCLDDPGGDTGDGQSLDISSCSGGGNQYWWLPGV